MKFDESITYNLSPNLVESKQKFLDRMESQVKPSNIQSSKIKYFQENRSVINRCFV